MLLGVLAGPRASWAQSTPPPEPGPGVPIVSSVTFEGNEIFPDATLALQVRTRPNRRFLSVPGFTWWLWLYRLGDSGALGERVGGALRASGEAPAYVDEAMIRADAERLQLFYQQEGFRQATVEARLDTTRGGRRVEVVFRIRRGAPTYVRQVRYDGVEGLGPQTRQRLVRNSLLGGAAEPDSAYFGFTARRQRYSEPTLHEERRRILTLLRNEGYAAVTRDSIRALVYPSRADSFDVVFRIDPGARYRFGDLRIVASGPDVGAPPRADTLYYPPVGTAAAGGTASVVIEDERKLNPTLLARALRIRPGDWYDQSDLLATKRRLEATGLFVFTDIVAVPGERLGAGVPRLDHRIELRTRRRHQVRLETFMLQRSSVVGATGDELGTGLGVSYQNANLFGGGETFRLSATGSVAAELSSLLAGTPDTTGALDEGILTSAQGELSASLIYPYLFGPFRFLEESIGLYDARTRLSLSYLTARRADLGLVLRGRGTARLRLEMQHTPTVTSLVDVIDLSLSNPDTLANFRATFLDKLLRYVKDPVQRAQIEEDYTQPQVNSALRYTLRSARVNPLRRDNGYSYELSAEAGNNLMYALDRYVLTPGTVEGSFPGLPFFARQGSDNRIIYRQYVRFIGDLRRYRPLDRGVVLATKGVVGIVQPTGRADVVPFDRRFFAGGASSVRGWGLRELGPGATDFVAAADTSGAFVPGEASNILGGEVKLEGSLELRGTMLRNVLAAEWVGALFTDAGNVWLGPRNPGLGTGRLTGEDGRFRFGDFYRQVGVGSGTGLRIAWEYLIVRFDVAWRVYDPARSDEGFFPDGLRRPQLHFGIGHAF